MKELFLKYKEVITYIFFGALTTFLNMFLFWLFNNQMGMKASIANIPATIICIIFAYITNKLFVFESKGSEGIIKEFTSFVGGRAITMIIGELIIYLGADLLHINSMAVKLFEQIFQVVGNYLISKFFVFKK